ncbi:MULTISPECIES: hydrogenase maturation protease [unclassified Roseofilum]|nr:MULTISPECIES: hydrogenase maturation protease [unclassified Roseofilum]MBP0026421.1 hydrogenase maturation protease [Roseofilum sp. SID2]MBP0034317.1 hydrogenase maturation protease [Roseofilum sp. Belize BBD 4]HBQ97352.1 hydrogenase maturation protease [Cyanobacteria bacterium UBA11691]MBP0007532.1 hydrogenase maturation protease [Roseofilum sp. Belize Diploria]MBP0012161.1 hydrogenase maturation protease [Roseofilum sp. SID3]
MISPSPHPPIPPSHLSPTVLVIGYGNLLRGDDGIGQTVAMRVEEWEWMNVRSRAVHQLMPELAQELSAVQLAIFVDAALSGDDVTLSKLEAVPEQGLPWGHSLSPPRLLSLCQWLYHTVPQAWMISVPGVDFSDSDRLSPLAQQRVKIALNHITHLIQNRHTL